MESYMGGLGVAVDVSPRRMSLTLSSSPLRKDGDSAAGSLAPAGTRGASPTTVLFQAFEGVGAAGASPRTASDDGQEAASPGDASAGLQRHLTRAQALVRPSRAPAGCPGAPCAAGALPGPL
jgi:hypothetical protein